MADAMTRGEMIARASELETEADQHEKRGRSGPARRYRDNAATLRSMAQEAAPDDPAEETYELAKGGAIDDHEARIAALEEWHDEWRLRVLTTDPAGVVLDAIDDAQLEDAPIVDDPDPAAEALDYEAMTQEVLHDLLAERELPVSGTKPEQIERLKAHDADPGDTVDADDAVNGAS